MHPQGTEQITALVFLDIALIVVVARVFGLVCRRLRQPTVVGEIVAGLALGPSLFGLLPGNPTAFMFPPVVIPYLQVIAGLGLIIFMFIVGLELDLGLLKGKGSTAAGISLVSVAFPFLLGLGLASWLYHSHATVEGHHVRALPFALFIGAAMSVTAFPVLARILSERRMQKTETGALALACAAVDDVLAWTMLAAVLAVVGAASTVGLVTLVAEFGALAAVLFLLVKPRLTILVAHRQRAGRLTPDIFAVVLVGVLVCSFLTSRIGVHSIFGAFLFGAIMPRRGGAELSADILQRLEQVTVLLLLPVFFITTGLNVDIGALGSRGLVELGAVLVVACAGKFLGASLAARAFRVPGRRATAIGVLMNTRGLTELVILNVGYESHILDKRLFTALVLMAVITTVITEPLLRLVYPDRFVARDIARQERASLGLTADYRVVAAVDGNDEQDARVVDVGVSLVRAAPSAELIVSRFDEAHRGVEVGAGLTSELAAIAASFESMESLTARATVAGVATVARSQFSENVARDLAAQVAAAEADVLVLTSARRDLVDNILVGVECAVVLVVGEGSSPSPNRMNRLAEVQTIVTKAGTGDDGLAAVEQACRVALALDRGLAFSPSRSRRERRREESLQFRLSAGGVTVRTDAGLETPPDEMLPVLGWQDWLDMSEDEQSSYTRSPTVLLVRGAVDDEGERLTTLLSARSGGSSALLPLSQPQPEGQV